MRKTILLFLIIAIICVIITYGFQFLAGYIILATGGWSAGFFSVPLTDNPWNPLLIPLLYISVFSSFIFFPLGAYLFYKLTKEDFNCPKIIKTFFIAILLLLALVTSYNVFSVGHFRNFIDQLPYKIHVQVDKFANCKVKNGLNDYSDADGWIREEYYCVNGIRQGPYKKFALHVGGYTVKNLTASALKPGDLLEEGTYKDGKQDGVVKQYEDLVVTSELTYENGLLNGSFKTYYKNGQLHEEGTYKNASNRDAIQFRDGIYRSYDEQGNLYMESEYKDGKPASNYTQSSEEQDYIRELKYQSERCKNQNGENKVFFNAGPVMTKFICKDGKLNGLYEEYYLSGSIRSRLMYVDGNREGQFQVFFESGKIETEGTYKNDKPIETFKYYNEDGSLKLEYKY